MSTPGGYISAGAGESGEKTFSEVTKRIQRNAIYTRALVQ